jgi:hypothetical protein
MISYQQKYADEAFPLILPCLTCKNNRYPNAPHEYAYIGNNYGTKGLKILFIGEIPNVDNDTAAKIKNKIIPRDYDDFNLYNTKIASVFPRYDPLCRTNKHKFAIGDMLDYLNRSLKKPFQQDFSSIAFTNVAHCYNKNGIDDRKQISLMMDYCWEKIILDLKTLKPDIVIGISSLVKGWFRWFSKPIAGPIINIHQKDTYAMEWSFQNESHENVRNFTYLYHPGRAHRTYKQWGNTFIDRMESLIAYYKKYHSKYLN